MTHVIEGTAEEITEVLNRSFSGRNLRVIIEDDEDLAAGVPAPPFAAKDEKHMAEMILAGMRSGGGTEMTEARWERIRREASSRAGQLKSNRNKDA